MTAEERKADFKQWLEKRGKNDGDELAINTLNTYVGGASRLLHAIKTENKKATIFDYGEEDIEEIKSIVEPEINSPEFRNPNNIDMKMGYLRYLEYLNRNSGQVEIVELSRFKKLLEWFVNQLRINNGIKQGVTTSGKGSKGNKIRELYKDCRSYAGFDLDCTVQGGYQKNIPGANYIHLTETWLNINPNFDSNNDVIELKINYKPDNKIITEYPAKTVAELGLFDGNSPNESLKEFFNDFKKEIEDYKANGQNTLTVNVDDTIKAEVEKYELNLILYGPPGTGKTYNTVPRAMAIIDGTKTLKQWEDDYEKAKKSVLDLFRAEIEKVTYNVATGKKYKTGQIEFVTFHQSYSYEEFIEGIKPDLASKDLKYKLADGVFKEFCNKAKLEENRDKNYVFIIDEINRGNVSKIFGELITLIEPSKRLGEDEEIRCVLPYSGEPFGVPKNVYILGTMNTADRSLVQLDAALRRRFDFKEMRPRPELLKTTKDGINLEKLLTTINDKIAVLVDREHQIGHSYFINLNTNSTVIDVKEVFEKKIIPLLEEYFFGDYEDIEEVLSNKFITRQNLIVKGEEKEIYKITVSGNAEDYISIYGGDVKDAANNG